MRALFSGLIRCCFQEDTCEKCGPLLFKNFVFLGWSVSLISARSASQEEKYSTIISPFHWNMLLHFSLLLFLTIIPYTIEALANIYKRFSSDTYDHLHFVRIRRKDNMYHPLGYVGEILQVFRQEDKKLAVFYSPLLSLNAIVLSFMNQYGKMSEQTTPLLPTIVFLYKMMAYLSIALGAFLAYKLFKSNRSQLISNFRIRSAISQRNEGILSNLHNEAIIHTAILSEYNKAFVHGRIYTLSERMEHSEFKYFQTYSSPERVETLFPRKRLVMKCARCDYESPTTDIALPLCGHTYHEYCFLKMARKDEFGVKCMVCDSLVRQQMIELARAYVRKQEVSVDGQKINPNEGDYSFSNSS